VVSSHYALPKIFLWIFETSVMMGAHQHSKRSSKMAKGDKKTKEGKGKPKLTTKEKQDKKKDKAKNK